MLHITDTIRPGDQAILTRTWPAGADGPNTPARTFTATLTVRSLTRVEDRNGPQWCLEGVEPELRGCWAIGRERNGMETTLVPA